jgi:hypothetical protein
MPYRFQQSRLARLFSLLLGASFLYGACGAPGLCSRFTRSIGAPGSAGRVELPVVSAELFMLRVITILPAMMITQNAASTVTATNIPLGVLSRVVATGPCRYRQIPYASAIARTSGPITTSKNVAMPKDSFSIIDQTLLTKSKVRLSDLAASLCHQMALPK